VSTNNTLEDLAAVFHSKQQSLYAAALAITRERDSARDVVHDALLAVAALKDQPANLEAYLFRTVRNKAMHSTNLERQFNRNVDPANFLDVENCTSDLKILAAQVTSHLSALEENPRQVIIMKLFADLTFSEIATIMSESPNTVASWYRRGLHRLKEEFHEHHTS